MNKETIEKYKQEMLMMKSRAVQAAASNQAAPENNIDGMGRLVVNVTTLDGLYPVPGALVTVFSGRDETRRNLDSNTSDESGRTKIFSLSAPQKSFSEDSGFEGETYSLYNISVAADGFLEQLHFGIPIFSGVTSLKNADLISLSVAGENTAPQVFEETVDYKL